MKKLFATIAALLLIAALAVSALATTMYVTKEDAKVRKKPSKHAETISQLPYASSVDVFETDGNWSHITYINKKGVERSGWIATKNLAATRPCKHEWTDWTVTKKATCTAPGTKQRNCKKCGLIKTKETKKAKHTWGPWTVVRQATCAAEGQRTSTCKVCGKKGTDKIEKLPHTWGEWAVEKAPTCSEKGVQSRTCKGCGGKETAEIETIPHTYGAWMTDKPLTRDTDGTRVRTCVICGYDENETVKAEPALARKDRGEAVRMTQQMLNDMGYNAGGADGIYGPKLDKAFTAFAKDHGVAFKAERVTPAQLDALYSSWADGVDASDWKGAGDAGTAVNLVLEMTPAESTEDVHTYNWTVVNQGSQACTLKAVLMGTGADHDFKRSAMVAALDSVTLNAKGADSASGTVNIPAELDDGALYFCALAQADKTGYIWLSNVASGAAA